ncbi:MAG: LysM peptidoglycan-binding domain-containing protein [Ilumatobacteraceae bacterium]
MSLVGAPIPAKPPAFTPDGAPPGVGVDLTALDGKGGAPWYKGRPKIKPRLTIVHTNGASVEAKVQSQINHGNRGPGNTKPHYAINQPTPLKLVPTDRRAIANSTGADLEKATGEKDCSFWSIAIETADMGGKAAKARGINWPIDCGPFLHDHAELVARIIAYEAIVWNIPLEYPDRWNGSGVATHTDPFAFPHYTIVQGKPCPGDTKKAQVRGEVLDRAREIHAAWTGTKAPRPAASDIPEPGKKGEGHYLIRQGDTPWGLATRFYKDGNRFQDILDANGNAVPVAGQRWTIPGFQGTWVTIQPRWGAFAAIKSTAAAPSASAVRAFWIWNGGDPDAHERGPLTPGEVVWVPA